MDYSVVVFNKLNPILRYYSVKHHDHKLFNFFTERLCFFSHLFPKCLIMLCHCALELQLIIHPATDSLCPVGV